MRFSVLQEHLARGLAVVSHAVASRATLPILSNVYLSTEDGGLRLTATNLEIAITHWIPAKVEEKGATTIPARILGDVVSGLPNEKIDLELLADGRINLKCGKHRSHLRATPADDYPPVGAAGERPTARIAQKTLRAALESTESGVSAWNGMLVARILAPTGADLRRAALRVLAVLRDGRPPPRVWMC